ncbi:MAG: tetratricopeptide repeat protein, partial [Chloroflexi bacterium]|nr:tetratricopeptide repeat protein [Chloroflexota bacterium]
ACALGQYAVAAQRHQASLALSQESQDRGSIARALDGLARVAYARQEYEKAQDLARQVLAITQELGHRWGTARNLTRLGEIASALGETQASQTYIRQALEIATALGAKPLTLEVLAGAAALLAQGGEAAPAVELAAFIQRQPAARRETRDQAARLLGELQAALPAEELTAARERGRAMTMEEAVDVAGRYL